MRENPEPKWLFPSIVMSTCYHHCAFKITTCSVKHRAQHQLVPFLSFCVFPFQRLTRDPFYQHTFLEKLIFGGSSLLVFNEDFFSFNVLKDHNKKFMVRTWCSRMWKTELSPYVFKIWRFSLYKTSRLGIYCIYSRNGDRLLRMFKPLNV